MNSNQVKAWLRARGERQALAAPWSESDSLMLDRALKRAEPAMAQQHQLEVDRVLAALEEATAWRA